MLMSSFRLTGVDGIPGVWCTRINADDTRWGVLELVLGGYSWKVISLRPSTTFTRKPLSSTVGKICFRLENDGVDILAASCGDNRSKITFWISKMGQIAQKFDDKQCQLSFSL